MCAQASVVWLTGLAASQPVDNVHQTRELTYTIRHVIVHSHLWKFSTRRFIGRGLVYFFMWIHVNVCLLLLFSKLFAFAGHTMSHFLGCSLVFVLFYRMSSSFSCYFVFLRMLPDASWLGTPGYSLDSVAWKSLSVETVAHIQADESFIPIALREQIWSWVECARRKPEWVTVSFSSVSSMAPLTSTRHPEWETAVAVLSD